MLVSKADFGAELAGSPSSSVGEALGPHVAGCLALAQRVVDVVRAHEDLLFICKVIPFVQRFVDERVDKMFKESRMCDRSL